MRRRIQTSAALGEGVGGVPAWVLESASVMAACRELAACEEAGQHPSPLTGWAAGGPFRGGHEALHALRRERRAAGEAWCAQQGLSYAITVQGALTPTAQEVEAGCTGGSRRAAVDRLRELVRR